LVLGRLEEAAIAFCGEFKVDEVVGNDLIDAGVDALYGDGVPLSLDCEHGAAESLGQTGPNAVRGSRIDHLVSAH
jgi:hypothetical protein